MTNDEFERRKLEIETEYDNACFPHWKVFNKAVEPIVDGFQESMIKLWNIRDASEREHVEARELACLPFKEARDAALAELEREAEQEEKEVESHDQR